MILTLFTIMMVAAIVSACARLSIARLDNLASKDPKKISSITTLIYFLLLSTCGISLFVTIMMLEELLELTIRALIARG